MKRSLLTFAALAFSMGALAQEVDPVTLGESAESETIAEGVEWLTWDELVQRMEREPRKILVFVYTDWCGYCRKMDATTMKDHTVSKFLTEQYYAVKLNGEHKGDIEFKGKTFKFVANGRRGYHELASELLQGKMSYPTLVFLDERFQLLQPIPGYVKAPDLEPILAYLANNEYKHVLWRDFQKGYQRANAQSSEIP